MSTPSNTIEQNYSDHDSDDDENIVLSTQQQQAMDTDDDDDDQRTPLQILQQMKKVRKSPPQKNKNKSPSKTTTNRRYSTTLNVNERLALAFRESNIKNQEKQKNRNEFNNLKQKIILNTHLNEIGDPPQPRFTHTINEDFNANTMELGDNKNGPFNTIQIDEDLRSKDTTNNSDEINSYQHSVPEKFVCLHNL